MSITLGGTNPAVTFPDGTIQNTAAVVNGSVPYSVLPTGSVLQVVQATTSTPASTTSGYITTGLSVSITPKFSTSKILVIAGMNGLYNNQGSGVGVGLAVYRNTTLIQQNAVYTSYLNLSNACITSAPVMALDSPATTSATTYSIYFARNGNAGTTSVQINNDTSIITVMEIAG